MSLEEFYEEPNFKPTLVVGLLRLSSKVDEATLLQPNPPLPSSEHFLFSCSDTIVS